jgi:endonuclease-8
MRFRKYVYSMKGVSLPEGPEIRRAADDIARVLVGLPVRRVSFSQPRLRHFGARFCGKAIIDVETRGKAILTHFDHGLTIYSHNQLYGVWKVVRAGAVPATGRSLRLAIHTIDHSALLYSASDISVWPTQDIDRHPFLARLGPDILSKNLHWKTIANRITSPEFAGRKLGSIMLDQSFIAGLGNYLRSEILFAAGLHPDLRPMDLSQKQVGGLARHTLQLSLRSYQTGGITNKPSREKVLKARGQSYEQRRFAVFGREGKPCYECGAPIGREDANSRPFYLCKHCQRPRR